MVYRLTKIALLACASVFALLVVFNNVTDYGSNFNYVQHVLSMDTTFEGNSGMWRRFESPLVHHGAYLLIIAFEASFAGLLVYGTLRLWRARHDAAAFAGARGPAVLGLAAGAVMWFGGFIAVGGEWFLMWQSEVWNGQEESAMFTQLFMLVLLYLTCAPDDAPA